MALEGEEDRNFLESANFFGSEHVDRCLEFIEDLSQMFNIDVNEGPDVRDAKVFETANGVDVVSDELRATHTPHTVCCSISSESSLLVFA